MEGWPVLPLAFCHPPWNHQSAATADETACVHMLNADGSQRKPTLFQSGGLDKQLPYNNSHQGAWVGLADKRPERKHKQKGGQNGQWLGEPVFIVDAGLKEASL